MLEHVGYSQAPGPGSSFSGVTGNGAPNAHYYLNSNKHEASSQQHSATANHLHHHHHHQHHQRLNGTGSNNNVSGVNAGMNPSANASTTTSTTNTNSTTSHTNGKGHKGSSAGNNASGGSITVTVTATTTTTTTATATTTTNANANANTHPHPRPAGAASSVHKHILNPGAKKVKTKRTKRAFLPHSTPAPRATSERTPSASSSPVNCKHNFPSPKTTSHQEKTSAKLPPDGVGWSSPVKRSVSCASPSLTGAGRSASPSVKEPQRSFSNLNNHPNTNTIGIAKRAGLPISGNQPPESTNTVGNHDQRAPDMLFAAGAPSELRKDVSFNTDPGAQNGHSNTRPQINGFHHEFSHSPSPALLRPNSHSPSPALLRPNSHSPSPALLRPNSHSPSPALLRPNSHSPSPALLRPNSHSPSPASLRSNSGVVVNQNTSNTPTSAVAKPQPAKSTSIHKENRTTPTVLDAIEIRSHSTTPESQSGGRPVFQQESTPNFGHIYTSHLDLENGAPNGTSGKRQHPDSSVSAKGADTTLKSLGRFTHTVIKKFKVNGVSHTAALVTSHPRFIPPNGNSLHAQSPIIIVDGGDDDDDGASSASPKIRSNRDDNANSASPVFMANGEDSFRSASSVVVVNGDGCSGSASPVVMMDVDDGVGSASPVIIVNGDDGSGSATPVTMTNGDKMGVADPIATTNGNSKIRPTTPPPALMNGVPGYPPPIPMNGIPGYPPPRIRRRPNREKPPFDSDAFDALIYAQPGAQSPPPGVCASEQSRRGSGTSQLEDRLFLHRNPAIQGMHERSEDWYRKKLKLRPPGGRKEWFGKVRERQRWLKSQEDKLSRPSDNRFRETISKRKDPEPWAHQRSLDFGDVPEDDLPSYVKENPAWLRFCGRLRDARTRMDTVDSSVQRQKRAKRRAEVDEKSLTPKQIAQRQLATKFRRQTEEFYNSMKQA